MSSNAFTGLEWEEALPDGFSCDSGNPKYRRFKYAEGILEYSIEGGEIVVDWVDGKNAWWMIDQILRQEGSGIRTISGYATDKLGALPDDALQRFVNIVARRLKGCWTARIDRIEGRRYLVMMRERNHAHD